ncbi:Sec-independent protein translocase subunit TatA [Streptomyces sp. XM4193]|uniref:Sec-independent protein translocase subunit TatA n=1 Tax=Streptomyces sp. XM4193 TaxID=2929782 RepID=UPI001FF9635B|nr:Sec-independent protein translocase subunit TatA [Streptomyces sp. XM4193]MCK1797927.1 Sec-independent protein translocase subunit TatA [Streptomyces sp. XM4193]
MIGQVGPWQLVILVALVVVIFGAKRLPDTARSLGKSLRILKSETAAMKKDGGSSSDTGRAESTEARTDADAATPSRTIQAAPGDVSSARPVDEPKRTSQG